MEKLAIIGFGGQGKQIFNAATRLLTDVIEVVAICDINQTTFLQAPKGGESWQILSPKEIKGDLSRVKIYQDFMELFDKETPDMVAVATWTKDHAAVVIESARRGVKKIFCETPLASCLDDADDMIRACKVRGVLLAANHIRRWFPDHQEIRRLVREEKIIGDLCHVWISCGGGRLSDLGTHWIDWARWIIGEEVSRVFSKPDGITEKNPRGQQFKDYAGEIFIVFRNGATAFVHEGQGIALPPRYELIGTTGRIFGEQLPLKWQIEVRPEKDPDPVTGYYGKLEILPFNYNQEIDVEAATAAALRELVQGKVSCSGEDSYKTLEVLIAAHEEGHVQIPSYYFSLRSA